MRPLLQKAQVNLFQKFEFLPSILGYEVTHRQEATFIRCSLNSSMFNIVCDTHLQTYQEADAFITQAIDAFKGQPFAWWLGAHDVPSFFPNLLIERGFEEENDEHAMAVSLDGFMASPSYPIKDVTTLALLENFISVIETIDPAARIFYEKIRNFSDDQPFRLFVGFYEGKAAVVGSLFFTEDCVGIFDLITIEAYRRKGLASAMLSFMMDYAKQRGSNTALLSAESDAGFVLYKKFGFDVIGRFHCFEWKERDKL